MALAAGDKLGPYEVLAVIGKGGMGEVYRAVDTRLPREIAIKTSQQRFSERFAREAKVIASLNHLKSGPISLHEAVGIMRQVADALDTRTKRAWCTAT